MLSVQHLVGRKPDGVLEAFRFQKLINLGRGEGGVTTEITPECLVPVSSDHRVQHIAPFMGAVHVARTQGATLQIAEPLSANITETPATFEIFVGRWR